MSRVPTVPNQPNGFPSNSWKAESYMVGATLAVALGWVGEVEWTEPHNQTTKNIPDVPILLSHSLRLITPF